ncbi:MAG: Na+/H+ antiporter NhaA [Hyphomonadaceae bacterium]|nr:Na+/H+ antiporter NhaA [Hyphomonadaceae bacterium]
MTETAPRSSRRSRAASAMRRFLAQESSGGFVLMAAAALALIVANSPAADLYFDALHAYVGPLSVGHWINDALMAVFFLYVGLEIKRELLVGELSTWQRRALPGIAALGGMIAPALIYAAINAGDPETLRGWAIPAATDIAFALGVLSLLGRSAPVSLKIFLTALAIIDDLGAVAIIALFYTSDLDVAALGGASACIAALLALNRFAVRALWPYLLIGVVLWTFVYMSGVHATLAGVLLAFTIPMGRDAQDQHTPLHRLEHGVSPWVAFAIVPIFGFANAGVSLAGITPQALLDPVPLGVAAGLFIGKQIGVFGAAWAAIKLNIADAPAFATTRQLYGVSLLCGIGFTMSLFIGLLAFDQSPALQDETKIGVLVGSLLSALSAALVLRGAKPQTPP